MAEKNVYSYDFLSRKGEREKTGNFDKKTLDVRNKILDEAREKVFMDMDAPDNEKSTRRASEKAIFYYVSAGDIVKISEMFEMGVKGALHFNTGDDSIIGEISDDARLQALGLMISSVTLCTRAAIDGGLPENIAYTLSDSYIRNGLKLTDHRLIMNLIGCTMYDFTYEVYKYKYKDCSMLIRKCCEYINRHLHDEITLKILAGITGRSANYISDLFYKELGIRPTEYIRKTKLGYACHVLEIANLSVSAISDLLAFPSASSFISYFKAEYGVTPLQYKKGRA